MKGTGRSAYWKASEFGDREQFDLHMHSKFTTLGIVFSILLFIVSGCRKPEAPLKLYVFDCGTLKSGNPAPLIERGVTTTDFRKQAPWF